MSEQFTIHFEPVGDHLQVSIPEIGVTVETCPGETSLHDATLAGTRAITAYKEQQRKEKRQRQHKQERASSDTASA